MSDSFVQIQPDSTGKMIDAQQLVNGASQNVYRQNVCNSDPSNINGVQTVQPGGSPSTSSDGAAIVIVRPDSGGSTGVNHSVNAPTLPTVGSTFSSGGAFSLWVLVATISANASRHKVTVDNMSGFNATAQSILIIRDDGTAASSATMVNPTAFVLNPKSDAGPEGGHWESTTFRGRIQVYAAPSTTPFISASED
jgi:hypothetical protein